MSEDDEEPVDPEVESEPELIVPELLDVPGREELAPEPAPLPMLPDCVSRPDEDDERLLSELELELDDLFFAFHLLNSDCDSEPSLLPSAVLNAPLRSELIAASVCEMRPSRLASSELKVAVPELELPEPELIEPAPWPIVELLLLLLCGLDEELLCGLEEVLLPGLVELCAYAVAAITAAATALITADFFMICPRELKVEVTGPCWPRGRRDRDVEKLRQAAGQRASRASAGCSGAPKGALQRLRSSSLGSTNITYYSGACSASAAAFGSPRRARRDAVCDSYLHTFRDVSPLPTRRRGGRRPVPRAAGSATWRGYRARGSG